MNCRDYRESLTALIDQELEKDERRSIEDHLSICSECRKEYDSLIFAFKLTEQVDPISLSPSVWEQVARSIASDRKQLERRASLVRMFLVRHWRPAAAAVGAVAASVLLFLPLSDSGTDRVLELEFTEFIRAREEISRQNRKEMFTDFDRRDHRGLNPFVKPVSQEQENPFRE